MNIVNVKYRLLEEIKYIREEYKEYIRAQVYNDYILLEEAIKIMLEDGDLQFAFQKYCTEERITLKEKELSLIHIFRVLRKRIETEKNEKIINEIFIKIEELNKESKDTHDGIYLYFTEVLFPTFNDVKKYEKYLGDSLKQDIKLLVEFWGTTDKELKEYCESIIIK